MKNFIFSKTAVFTMNYALFFKNSSFYNELYTVRLGAILRPFWHRLGSMAELSRAEPSRAEPSRAGPGRAGTSRAEPSRAEPSRAGPSRADSSRFEPGRADPDASRAGPGLAGPRPKLSAGRAPFFLQKKSTDY